MSEWDTCKFCGEQHPTEDHVRKIVTGQIEGFDGVISLDLPMSEWFAVVYALKMCTRAEKLLDEIGGEKDPGFVDALEAVTDKIASAAAEVANGPTPE